jgi:Flp pilus assembly pilin Flp
VKRRGQDPVEYGIVLIAIAVIVLIVLSYFGTSIVNWIAGH